MRHRAFLASLGAAILTLLAGAPVAADRVGVDGDIVRANDQNPVSLGVVRAGAVIVRQVSFQLRCTGRTHVD